MNLWNLKKSFPLFVLLCACVLSFTARLVLAKDDSEIDTRIANLNNLISEKEKSLIKINEQMLYDRSVYESALDAYHATSWLRIQANKELEVLYNQKKELMSGAFTQSLPEALKLGNQSEAEQKP